MPPPSTATVSESTLSTLKAPCPSTATDAYESEGVACPNQAVDESLRPLPSPAALKAQIAPTQSERQRVTQSRDAIRELIQQDESRLLVVVGPCSIHDPVAALEYAENLALLSRRFENELLIVMRTYFEKPRSSLGWKGLINDPHLDGSGDMATGLMLARQLLRDINALGLPCAGELLDPNLSGYLVDLLSWAAIGARTSASQPHRELASSLDLPVGFKNGVDGSVDVATDAMRAARHAHHRVGLDDRARLVASISKGNPDCHLVLRGGHSGPNFDADSVLGASRQSRTSGGPKRVMIDVSHANSGKDPRRQPTISSDVARQVEHGAPILGVMMESHLVAGKQHLDGGPRGLTYGQSITDACVDLATTGAMLERLAQAWRRLPD